MQTSGSEENYTALGFLIVFIGPLLLACAPIWLLMWCIGRGTVWTLDTILDWYHKR